MSETRDWPWYCAPFEDASWSGPYTTRDDAIDAGWDNWPEGGFYVAQAINPPVRIADWIGADDAVERAGEAIMDSDRASSEYEYDYVFSASADQEKDLAARIKRACDEWQEAHGLVFTCNTFESMTAPEYIPAREAQP